MSEKTNYLDRKIRSDTRLEQVKRLLPPWIQQKLEFKQVMVPDTTIETFHHNVTELKEIAEHIALISGFEIYELFDYEDLLIAINEDLQITSFKNLDTQTWFALQKYIKEYFT